MKNNKPHIYSIRKYRQLFLFSSNYRMDICHWNLTTSVDTISFRWIIIVMLYLSTIILSLSAESMDERLYLNQKNSTVWEHESVSAWILIRRKIIIINIVEVRTDRISLCLFANLKISLVCM